jgi:hypothetical protein
MVFGELIKQHADFSRDIPVTAMSALTLHQSNTYHAHQAPRMKGLPSLWFPRKSHPLMRVVLRGPRGPEGFCSFASFARQQHGEGR